MKRMWSIALFALLSLSLLPAQDWSTLVKKYGPAIGKVEIKDGASVEVSGTGFLIDGKGGILTNAHVVTEAKYDPRLRIVVTFPYGLAPSDKPKEYVAKIEKIEDMADLDLAFLRIDGSFGTYCSLAPEDDPPLMSEVLVMGFPLGLGFKSTPGFIQAYQEIDGIGHMLDLSAAVDAGNSGGPVFGKDGRVVGIVTAKVPGFNFNLALPSKSAKAFRDAKMGKLSVRTAPDGARVYVNGTYRGASPLDLELLQKDYPLRIEKDGYATVDRTIAIGESESVDVTLEQEASSDEVQLTISSIPPGATVIVDNDSLGVTPLQMKGQKGSRIRIKLLLRGYKECDADPVLGDDPEQKLEYALKKSFPF